MADINIYGTLNSKTGDGKLAKASQIYDEALGKFQSEINQQGGGGGDAYGIVYIGEQSNFTESSYPNGYYTISYSGSSLYGDINNIWNQGKIPVLKVLLSIHTSGYSIPLYKAPNNDFNGHERADNGNYTVDVIISSNSGVINTRSVGTYSKPSGGIPASDLASGVIPDVSGKENTSNKTSDISTNKTSTTKYPTTKGVADYLDAELAGIEDVLDAILGDDTLHEQKKMDIVSASGTTLSAAVNTYYNFASEVNTLAVTLPSVTDSTHINNIVFMLTTGSTPAVTFAAPTGIDVIAQDGFSIEASTTYEINAIFNGTSWVIAAMKLSTTPINS